MPKKELIARDFNEFVKMVEVLIWSSFMEKGDDGKLYTDLRKAGPLADGIKILCGAYYDLRQSSADVPHFQIAPGDTPAELREGFLSHYEETSAAAKRTIELFKGLGLTKDGQETGNSDGKSEGEREND